MDQLHATIKSVTDEGHGGFTAVASTSSIDRDGESVVAGAFEPLPETLPIYHDHDWKTGAAPVGRGRPYYDGDTLMVEATFASTERAQEMRTLVSEGVVDSVSVGFLDAKRTKSAGTVEITSAELFEASLTAIPSNRDALLVAAKSLQADADTKVFAGSHEERSDRLRSALAADEGRYWVHVLATYEDSVVYESGDYDETPVVHQRTYTIDGETVTLGDAAPVTLSAMTADRAAATAQSDSPAGDAGGDAPEAAATATEDTKALDDRLAAVQSRAARFGGHPIPTTNDSEEE